MKANYGGQYLSTMTQIEQQLDILVNLAGGMQGSFDAFAAHLVAFFAQIEEADLGMQAIPIDWEARFENDVLAHGYFDTNSASDDFNSHWNTLWQQYGDLQDLQSQSAAFAWYGAVAQGLADALSFISGLHQQVGQVNAAIDEIERLDNELTVLEQQQDMYHAQAQRHAATATFLNDSNNPLKRNTYTRAADVAERALRRSKIYSFIARRAIEFKLVTDLQKETGTEPFVDSPRLWSDAIFGATYPGDPTHTDYSAESTTGYVNKLRDFVNAYPFIYPFQDGQDWAVISLRDDYLRPAIDCFLASPPATKNLLPWSEDFSQWSAQVASATHYQGEDPLGGSSATHVFAAAKPGSVFFTVPLASASVPGGALTLSVWMRSDTR